MNVETFTNRALSRCAQGTSICVLDVLGALEQISGQEHPLDVDQDSFTDAITIRARDLSPMELEDLAAELQF